MISTMEMTFIHSENVLYNNTLYKSTQYLHHLVSDALVDDVDADGASDDIAAVATGVDVPTTDVDAAGVPAAGVEVFVTDVSVAVVAGVAAAANVEAAAAAAAADAAAPAVNCSPVSNCFNSLNRAAASLMRLNSIQNACTSMNKSWTLRILFLIKAWRNTHTRRTRRFCMYLSLIVSHVEMQLEMYRWTNSVGRSTA